MPKLKLRRGCIVQVDEWVWVTEVLIVLKLELSFDVLLHFEVVVLHRPVCVRVCELVRSAKLYHATGFGMWSHTHTHTHTHTGPTPCLLVDGIIRAALELWR